MPLSNFTSETASAIAVVAANVDYGNYKDDNKIIDINDSRDIKGT